MHISRPRDGGASTRALLGSDGHPPATLQRSVVHQGLLGRLPAQPAPHLPPPVQGEADGDRLDSLVYSLSRVGAVVTER